MPPSAATQISGARRIPGLDGLRGVAILLVLFLHLPLALRPSESILDHAVFAMISNAWIGVDIFFVLSGFLITGILLQTKGASHYWRNFYARRALRIFPLYYAFLILYLVVMPLVPVFHRIQRQQQELFPLTPHSQWWFWLFASNILFAWKGEGLGMGVTWSLAVEEQFYLFWPILVSFVSAGRLKTICILILIGSVLLRGMLSCFGISYPATYMLLPTHMDGLVMGAIIALIVRTREINDEDALYARIVFCLSAASFVLLVLLANHQSQDVRRNLYSQAPLYTVLATAFGSVIVLVLNGGRLANLLSMRWLRSFGKFSYSLYLFHRPIGALLGRLTGLEQRPLVCGSRVPWLMMQYLMCIPILYFISFCCWHLFEKRCLSFQRFFPSRGE